MSSLNEISTEPVFVNFWSPGIDSEEPIPLVYVVWRAGMTNRANRVVVPARQAGNRFLGYLKDLQIRAQINLEIGRL
jgi:hypothetical protein